MRKFYDITLIVLFISILFGLSVCFLLKSDDEFSESENRYLAGKPDLSADNIFSGEFMKDTDKYIDDQFPGRDFWTSIKSDFQRFTGNKEINGVYLAEDNYLIEKWLPNKFDENQLNKNIEALNEFSKRHSELKNSLMLVPTASMVYKDKLPKNAPVFNQQIAYNYVSNGLKDMSLINLNTLFLAHSGEQLYYKTDHHWTTYGAFLAYSMWCETNGKTVDLNEFDIETAAKDFQGTLQSKVLGTYCAFDKIDIYKRKDQKPYQVFYNFGKIQSNTVYAMEKLGQKDKYQVFFNGNHPEITIKTEQKNGKRLLIIKDSYANAFVPFLINDYEAIYMIDLRYYNGDVDKYIDENHIDECLFLYNVKNFSEDENISYIKD